MNSLAKPVAFGGEGGIGVAEGGAGVFEFEDASDREEGDTPPGQFGDAVQPCQIVVAVAVGAARAVRARMASPYCS